MNKIKIIFKRRDFLKKVPLLFLFSFYLSTGCSYSSKQELVELSGQTMGTVYKIKFYSSIKSQKEDHIHNEIKSILKEVNRQMSTYIQDSEITLFNNLDKTTPIKISPWFAEVLQYSLELARSTDGIFDPTIGPLVNLWGFGPSGVRKVPDPKEILIVKSYVGFKKLSLIKESGQWLLSKKNPKVNVDLSATAKGFAVDKISEYLISKGFARHLVDIGGELKVHGKKDNNSPWIVAVEKPNEYSSETQGKSVQLSFPLENYAIATSGSYRNFFEENREKYSHTIDVMTGQPIKHDLISVSILEPTCMKADGLATALQAMGLAKALVFAEKNKISAYFISSNQVIVDQALGTKTRDNSDNSAVRFSVQMSEGFKKLSSVSKVVAPKSENL